MNIIHLALVQCKMAFFKRVWHNVKVRPVWSVQVQFDINQGFKMRHWMNIYLKGLWSYKRSKLKFLILFNKNGFFLELSTLTFHISKTTCGIYSYNTSFESPNQWLLGLRRIKGGSTFTLCHAFLKKAILQHKRTQGMYVYFFHDCMQCWSIKSGKNWDFENGVGYLKLVQPI